MFFYDSNKLKIGEYSNIINLDDQKVVIRLLNESNLVVEGMDLKVIYFDKEEIIIEGIIRKIEIIYEKTNKHI